MTQPSDDVRIVRREIYDNETVVDTEFVVAPELQDADPFARTRLVPRGQYAGSEIITQFAPSNARPASYPAELPFVAQREVWTTESPAGTGLNGARWPGADIEVMLAAVVEASIADGWRVIAPPAGDKLLGTPDVVLLRSNVYRELQVVRVEDSGIIQLWDVPTTWFDRVPPRDQG